MLYSTEVIIPPATQVISVDYVKSQLVRSDGDYDDALLSQYIDSATKLAEAYLNRVLVTQTLKWTIAHTPIPQTSNMYFGNNWVLDSTFCPLFGSFSNQSLSLPRSPVQSVLAVSQGYWNQTGETFLTEGTDYFVDLNSTPARVQMYNFNSNFCLPQHLSVVYVAGYAMTNTLSLAGTAQQSSNLTGTVGAASFSITVNTGDTAAIAAQNLYTALGAAAGAPQTKLITPTLFTFRGDSVGITIISAPAGLTLTPGSATSSIPSNIINGICNGVQYLYQNLADPSEGLGSWFYAPLAPDRIAVFG